MYMQVAGTSDCVPPDIIDPLEVVNIDHEKRDASLGVSPPYEHIEFLVQTPTIRKTSQRVHPRQCPQLIAECDLSGKKLVDNEKRGPEKKPRNNQIPANTALVSRTAERKTTSART